MESLEKHVLALVDILEKQHGLYEQIHELVESEKGVLIDGDIDRLEKNLSNQRQLSGVIHTLEAKRIEELEIIGIYLGEVPERIKLSAIARQVDSELSATLLGIEDKFKTVLRNIMRINKTNKYLITRSLQFIEKNIQVFFGALEEKGLYNPTQKKARPPVSAKRMVDWRA